MAKGKLVQLRVEADDWERWRAEAERRGMSLSALVRWAMDRPLRDGCWGPVAEGAPAEEPKRAPLDIAEACTAVEVPVKGAGGPSFGDQMAADRAAGKRR